MDKQPQEKSLTLNDNLGSTFKTTFAEKLEIVKQLAGSTLVPKDYRNNESDLMLVLNYSEMLGINYALGVTELYPINGRITMGVHLAEALLLACNDISYVVVEDSVPIYYFQSNGKVIKVFTEKELEDAINPKTGNYEIVTATQPKETFNKERLQLLPINPPYIPVDKSGNAICIDRRTTILFKRLGKNVEVSTSYTLSEAYQAGLPQEKEYTWGKYQRDLMYARCFGRISRRYGGDKVKNIFLKEEMTQYEDTPYEEVD